MKENTTTPIDSNAANPKPFEGYTMEELKYQRAMMALRKEFAKAKVMKSVQGLMPSGKGKKKKVGAKPRTALFGQVVSKVLNNLNTLDYILMGMSIIGTVRKGYKLIRGKK